jgi:5-methylcytosine-specific restriction enzyme A
MDGPDRRPHGWRPTVPAHKRGYGTAHKRLRRELFREEPNCRECAKQGRTVKATHADHIVPLCLGGPTVRENYQPLCEPHSRAKSAREGAHYRHHIKPKLKKGKRP